MLPPDIDPASRCRLPLPKREDFDEEGQKVFDYVADPKGQTIRGLIGPGGVSLHSPKLSQITRPVASSCALNQASRRACARSPSSSPPANATAASNGPPMSQRG